MACLCGTCAIHVCSCGTRYTPAAWRILPLSYVRHDDDLGWREARNCPCGSTREIDFEALRVEQLDPVHCEHCDAPTYAPIVTRLGDEAVQTCSVRCATICGDCGAAQGVRQAVDEHDGWLVCAECEQLRLQGRCRVDEPLGLVVTPLGLRALAEACELEAITAR